MKGWQRWLTFTLAMLLAWTPLCASHAQETTDSFCLRMALTVETDAASEAMHALGVHLDEEEQRTLDAMIALLNAAEVRIQLGLTGEQLRVSLVMSEIELLYLQEDVYQGTRYVTTNLMPGVALTVPQREVWDVAQALWRMDWSGLGQALKSDVEQWALSLDGQYEEGMFLGYAIPAASARTSYSLDDRDLAVLVDAWTNTLLTRTDAAAVADAMYGDGYWNAWLSMVQDFNRQVSWENQYGYDVSVLWDATGEPVGTIISGNLRESQERPWQLSVGWSGQDVDMLATLPQEGEDMLLRYTLSQDQQDGTQTISQRMHLLSAEAGESYDSAAEGAAYALLMEGETRFSTEDTLWQANHQGNASLRAEGLELRLHQAGESRLDLQTLSAEGITQTYLGEDTLLCKHTLSGQVQEAAAVPDFTQMTVFPMESAPYQNEVYDALQQGLDQLTVRIFKAIPPECIDIITQMVMELP